MSATNTTTNYSLPIFIGADKPAWLVDFNGAMNAIDAQMKVNADAIATKSPILTFNDTTEIDFTKSGNIITASLASGVSDKVGRALVTPISAPASDQVVAINTAGQQENLTIGSGLSADNGIISAVDLNLTNIQNVTNLSIISGSGVTVQNASITVATNAEKTVGKIYGLITIAKTGSTERVRLNTGIKVVVPDDAFTISPAGIAFQLSTDSAPSTADVIITSDGTVHIEMSAYTNQRNRAILLPCLYFFENFGDVITP